MTSNDDMPNRRVRSVIHAHRGLGCASEPRVTCSAGIADGNCLNKLGNTRTHDAEEMSFALGEACVDIVRDYDMLYYKFGEEEKMIQCERKPDTFYDVLHCISDGKLPEYRTTE